MQTILKTIFFYNIIGQKTEAGFLDFLYSLLSLKFDIWYYLYLVEYSDQGNILLWHLGADCNRWLWNYKITQFTVFVQHGWGVDVNFWMFATCGTCEQNQTSVNKAGGGGGGWSKLWSFCDNILIECPL